MSTYESELQRALQILDSPGPVAAPAPVNNYESELQRAMSILDTPSQPQGLSNFDTALQVGRGYLASGPGATIDLLQGKNLPKPKGYLSPEGFRAQPELASKMSGKSPEEVRNIYETADKYALPELNAERNLTGLYDMVAGKNLTPTNTKGKIAQGVGEFFTPTGILSKGKAAVAGGKSLVKAIGKKLAQNTAAATGASAAVHSPGHLTKEGGVGRIVEDVGRGVIGGMAGRSAISPIQSAKGIGQSAKNLTSQIISMGTRPEKEVLKNAKKHGIELPHNVGTGTGMGARMQNFIANNWLSRDLFSSRRYKDAYDKAEKVMSGKVKSAVSNISESKLKPSESSGDFKHFAKKEEAKAQKNANKLYDTARSHLTENDKIIPTNTEKAILDIEKKLDKPIRGSSSKEVARHLATLAEDWKITKDGKKVGIFEPGDLSKWESQQYSRENLREMFGKLKVGAKEIPTEEFVKAIQGINEVLGAGDTRGAKRFLLGLKGAIAEDLGSSHNKAFLKSHNEATEFYKNNIGKRFGKKTSRTVLRDEGAIQAYSHLGTVDGIKRMERLAGNTPEGLSKINALKKQKAIEIFEGAFEGGMENGKLKKDAFAKLFEKNSGKQEVIERLIGKKQYKDLEEISKISRSFSDHGKDLLNTSHSGSTMYNFGQAGALGTAAISMLFGFHPIKSAGTAGAIVLTPYVASRLLSNPEIIRKARVFALARQKGNNKYASALMGDLLKTIEREGGSIKGAIAKNAPERGEKNEH